MTQEACFPPKGLTYFWFLNHRCREQSIDRQIEAFAEGGIGTVCLHPRDGLLLPYGGEDWFEFIRRTAGKLASKGIGVWLYDEDPYPSGNAGGRIIRDHPEFQGRSMEMYQAGAEDIEDGLFAFPANGELLWCGFVSTATASCVRDLTPRVGMIRRQWDVMRGWDSRWYYPATPLYDCDRAATHTPEYAVRIGESPDGAALVAFVAEPVGRDSKWGGLVDMLNPRVTECFIERTHERYYREMGEMFGREVTAIFTDEPKYHGAYPHTEGMFEDFSRAHGYDLRPRLYHLFCEQCTEQVIRTRIDFRQWCARRFETAWLQPVADWCHAHDLKLVGHISPEDDLVQQAGTISNLFPLHKHFDLAGLDLIIPAVGDADHPIINVGIVSAASACQQQDKAGVMSESLAASGPDFTGPEARKIINWQTTMGLNSPVVHGAFLSMEGNRAVECPPDYGPASEIWPQMVELNAELPALQEIITGARQIAPVAILWPIRSFFLRTDFWQPERGGQRAEFLDLLLACLEGHVGVHLLDEPDLWAADIAEEGIRIGRASYTTVLLPAASIWHEKTLSALQRADAEGLSVLQCGSQAEWVDRADGGVERLGELPYASFAAARVAAELPCLAEVAGPDAADVRVTAWETADDGRHLLVNYMGQGRTTVTVEGETIELEEGDVRVLTE